ncbi:MAG: SBBP repeat-containing protein, partial [Candidatus Hodarchaeales archaeon]
INEITIDTQGNIIVTGTTMSSDFPITTDAYQSSISSTHSDIFIAKYNSSGQITYATYFGGSHSDYSFGLATDSLGNIIIAGKTLSDDFPTINAWQANYSNIMVDGFVTKFSADGQELIFSSYFGGAGWDIVIHINIDSNDNIIASGFADIYSDPNSFPILDAFQEEIRGRCDIIIMMISPNGEPIFGTYLGGGLIDHPFSQYLTSDYLYIVGFTESVNFLTTSNAYQQTIRGYHDGFLFRFDIDSYLTTIVSETTTTETTGTIPTETTGTIPSETTGTTPTETTGITTTETTETTPSFEPLIVLVGLLTALGIGLRIRVKNE